LGDLLGGEQEPAIGRGLERERGAGHAAGSSGSQASPRAATSGSSSGSNRPSGSGSPSSAHRPGPPAFSTALPLRSESPCGFPGESATARASSPERLSDADLLASLLGSERMSGSTCRYAAQDAAKASRP